MKKIQTITRAYVNCGTKVFLFSDNTKAFCVWDIISKQFKILEKSPFEEFSGCDAFIFDDYIYITSNRHLYILKFHIPTNECTWINGLSHTDNSSGCYIYSVLTGGYIYFFPQDQEKNIWLYNVKSNSYSKIESTMNGKGYFPFFSSGIYGTVDYGSDVFFLMNMKNSEVKKYSLNNADIHLQSIYYDGLNAYFILTDQSALLKYNLYSKKFDKFIISQKQIKDAFRSFFVFKNYLLLLPKYGNLLICWDMNDDTRREIYLINSMLEESGTGRKYNLPMFSGAIEYKGWFYFPPYRMKQCMAWNLKSNEILLLDMNCDKWSCVETGIIDLNLKNGEINYEGYEWDLDLFLDKVKEMT